mgnify:CR=1 FL=1
MNKYNDYTSIPPADMLKQDKQEADRLQARKEAARQQLLVLDAKVHEPFFLKRVMEAHEKGWVHLSIKAKDLPCAPEAAEAYFESRGYRAYFGSFSFVPWRKSLEVWWS